MARVELKNVFKTYQGGVNAVKDASLVVEDKEFVVLVGPSGCGKSTTLRMIAGLEDISSGEVRIDGRVVNDVAPKDRDIAMVFQNYALYPHMTVFKNMAFGLTLRRLPSREIEQRVHEAAKILSIEHLLNRKPKALSGGERQRVAVGRAIVRNPKVFLFDEPLSNLDAKLRVQMRAEINKLHNRLQSTMIYVTHDQVEAMTMGDRIVVMLGGVIQQIATPLELYNRPVNKFVAGFIGSPPMNMIDGEIYASNGALRFRSADGTIDLLVDASHRAALEAYSGKKITLGIRPEHFSENATQTAVDGKSLSAKVEVVEPMGSEIYLYLALGKQTLTARIISDTEPAVDAPHVIDVAMDRAHYFDPSTEKTIRGA
ncbi:MAG TPA: sn-glycerol-3-phosphate ABC transporter ATP-binding protein UgpC [Candidatus Hydrogenedentes bacterium]|nr:sn-glycerol-3-phosphate ABC transporter ATP-binding protein UgpC [Candidatus Hydrogenedentota bacterium]